MARIQFLRDVNAAINIFDEEGSQVDTTDGEFKAGEIIDIQGWEFSVGYGDEVADLRYSYPNNHLIVAVPKDAIKDLDNLLDLEGDEQTEADLTTSPKVALEIAINVMEGFKESSLYDDHKQIDGWTDEQFQETTDTLKLVLSQMESMREELRTAWAHLTLLASGQQPATSNQQAAQNLARVFQILYSKQVGSS